MIRILPVLVFLVACGTTSPEAAVVVSPPIEVQMKAVELMIPASQAEMLKEEIVALRAETSRLKTELDEAKMPSVRKIARQVVALEELAAAESQLRSLRAELDKTKDKLIRSEARNEELIVEVEQAKEELTKTADDLQRTDRVLRRTRDDLRDARGVASDAGWSDLVGQAQVALCPKGSRSKMENCRSHALIAISPIEGAARECLQSGQAAPQLQRAGRGEDLPHKAVWVDGAGSDYYVLLCDPTLPEARDLLAAQSRRGGRQVVDDKRVERASDRSVERPAVAKVSRERAARARQVQRAPEKVEASNESSYEADEPHEPTDLLSDDAPSVGFMDLDADAGDDEMSAKDRRREAKAEKERLSAAARRRNALDGAGDDLLDE